MHTIILNPISGNGNGKRYLPEVERTLSQHGISYEVFTTGCAGDATSLVGTALQNGTDCIIAVGGDGTLFEIINGMADTSVPLLFVPCGTGNDFIKALKLPKDPIEALKVQLESGVSQIDIGRMNGLRFMNVAGTGFDVDVLRKTERHKAKHSGLKAYFLGLIDAIREYKPMEALISIDGKESTLMRFAIISIGNGNYIGGGMKAVPYARVNDGLFDVSIVKPVKKFMIPVLVIFFILGLHLRIGLGKVYKCRSIRINAGPMTVNLDGELHDAESAEFELLPNNLSVQIPSLNE